MPIRSYFDSQRLCRRIAYADIFQMSTPELDILDNEIAGQLIRLSEIDAAMDAENVTDLKKRKPIEDKLRHLSRISDAIQAVKCCEPIPRELVKRREQEAKSRRDGRRLRALIRLVSMELGGSRADELFQSACRMAEPLSLKPLDTAPPIGQN